MSTGGFCGLDHFSVGCVQAAVPDVFHDGSGKKMRILKHHGDILAKHVALDGSDIYVVDRNLPGFNIIKSIEEICNCGFASAGRSDERNLLSWFCVKRNML